jgi:putative spermidine/putrescine transport system substrate-binding protein
MEKEFVSRKKIWVLIVFTLALSVFLIDSFGWAQDSKELVVAGWGGASLDIQKKAFFDPFEKATGVKVTHTGPPLAGKIKAQVMSKNVEWDLAHVGPGILGTLSKEGLLEKIDYNQVSKDVLKDIPSDLRLPEAIGFYYFSLTMAYRTDVFPKGKEPKNWKDFWDVKQYPGPRSFWSPGVVGAGLEFALMADGVSMGRIYPIDMGRAWKSLDRIRPYVVKWWREGAEPAQLLTDKEVVLATAYNGRIEMIKNQGVPVEVQWNEGQLWPNYFIIPKGAKNYKTAMKCIEFSLDAKRQADYANAIAYGPVNMKAFQYISSERAKDLPSSPENMKKQFVINNDWYAENMTKVIEEWNAWILKR